MRDWFLLFNCFVKIPRKRFCRWEIGHWCFRRYNGERSSKALISSFSSIQHRISHFQKPYEMKNKTLSDSKNDEWSNNRENTWYTYWWMSFFLSVATLFDVARAKNSWQSINRCWLIAALFFIRSSEFYSIRVITIFRWHLPYFSERNS